MRTTTIYVLLLMFTVLTFSSCKKSAKTDTQTYDNDVEITISKKVKLILEPQQNPNATGKVVLKEQDNSVTITAIISGLSPGEHPIYIVHENTKSLNFGNLIADDNGNGTFASMIEDVCLSCHNASKNLIGRRLIVYSGNETKTISCSVVIKYSNSN